MKKQKLWVKVSGIFFLLLLPSVYGCDFDVVDHYYESLNQQEKEEYVQNFSKNKASYLRQKNVTLYEDFPDSGPMSVGHALFLKADKLYAYGQPVLTIDPKNYQYLGNGFFRHQDSIYFMKIKVAAYMPNQRIQTYTDSVKPENRSMSGTSCEGVFDTPIYYLKTNHILYQVILGTDGEAEVTSSKLTK